MRDALLFGMKRENGRVHLDGLKARMAIPLVNIPDIIVHYGKLYVFHYEGVGEVYYREASVYHFHKSAIMVDGVEIDKEA